MIGPIPLTFHWLDAAARDCYRKSLKLWQKTDNLRAIALALVCLGFCEAELPLKTRLTLMNQGLEAARKCGDPWAIAFCLQMANTAMPREDIDVAAKRAAMEESIAPARQSGDQFRLCRNLHGMGDVYHLVEDYEAAEPWHLESLAVAREIAHICRFSTVCAWASERGGTREILSRRTDKKICTIIRRELCL